MYEVTAVPQMALTVEQAARQLGIGRTKMYSLVMSGQVESVLVGRLRRVPIGAVASYLDELLAAARTASAA